MKQNVRNYNARFLTHVPKSQMSENVPGVTTFDNATYFDSLALSIALFVAFVVTVPFTPLPVPPTCKHRQRYLSRGYISA